jgi:hypothetical protein
MSNRSDLRLLTGAQQEPLRLKAKWLLEEGRSMVEGARILDASRVAASFWAPRRRACLRVSARGNRGRPVRRWLAAKY